MMRFVFAFAAFFAAMPAWATIEIEEVTTPGGIDAWLVEDHSIPFVALELRFRGGASLDPEGKRGVTNLMVGLLEEGAETWIPAPLPARPKRLPRPSDMTFRTTP